MSGAPLDDAPALLHRDLVWIGDRQILLWDGGADEHELPLLDVAGGWSSGSVAIFPLPDSDEWVVQVEVVTADFTVPQGDLWTYELDPPADRATLRLTDGWFGIGEIRGAATLRVRLRNSLWTTQSPLVDLGLLASEDSRRAWVVVPRGTEVVEVDDPTRDRGDDRRVDAPPPGWRKLPPGARAPDGRDVLLHDGGSGALWIVTPARADAMLREAYFADAGAAMLHGSAWVGPDPT